MTDAIAPGYSRIITNPMDLSTMTRRVKQGKYSNLEDFERDLKLIFDNCARFNGPVSTYSKVMMSIFRDDGAPQL